MSKPLFHEWAQAEITRLREEADALQKALDLYARVSTRPRLVSPPASSPIGEDGRRRPSKYDDLFRTFEREGRALSLDEMITLAVRQGIDMDRNKLRSQVFFQKNAGRVEQRGQGYFWGSSKTKPAPSVEEGAG